MDMSTYFEWKVDNGLPRTCGAELLVNGFYSFIGRSVGHLVDRIIFWETLRSD